MAEQRDNPGADAAREQRGPRVDAFTRVAPEQFLRELLAAQCRTAPAEAGAFIRVQPPGRPEALAVHPPARPGQSGPAWLTAAIEAVAAAPDSETPRLMQLEGGDGFYGDSVATLALLPIPLQPGEPAQAPRGVGAFLIRTTADAAPGVAARLELSSRLVHLFGLQARIERREGDVERMRRALDVVAASAEPTRFVTAATAMCNHLGTAWGCERVSLGVVRGRAVRAAAISHTEKIVRATSTVQAIEAAMEESADQDLEVVHPDAPDSPRIGRAARELSEREGGRSVCTLPLRHAEAVVGALTLERAADRPFDADELATLRLVCELTAGRLVNLSAQDRWFGARAAAELRRWGAALVGPKHTWAKLAAGLVIAATLFLVFAKGTYRVEGTFRLDSVERRVAPAPFDGVLREVLVDVGDEVARGDVLARLDDSELRLQLVAAEAELASLQREVAIAQRERKEAEAQMARAKTEKAEAEIALLRERIDRAELRAPVSGRVVTGDLRRLVGAPVRQGETMFEVAPIDALRAEVYVPEADIADVAVGQPGRIATATFPDRRLAVVVERIDPVAEAREQKNVFRVRARLDEAPAWLRPGMEGVARIDAGERRYAWIWTRRVVNWVRMRLWI